MRYMASLALGGAAVLLAALGSSIFYVSLQGLESESIARVQSEALSNLPNVIKDGQGPEDNDVSMFGSAAAVDAISSGIVGQHISLQSKDGPSKPSNAEVIVRSATYEWDTGVVRARMGLTYHRLKPDFSINLDADYAMVLFGVVTGSTPGTDNIDFEPILLSLRPSLTTPLASLHFSRLASEIMGAGTTIAVQWLLRKNPVTIPSSYDLSPLLKRSLTNSSTFRTPAGGSITLGVTLPKSLDTKIAFWPNAVITKRGLWVFADVVTSGSTRNQLKQLTLHAPPQAPAVVQANVERLLAPYDRDGGLEVFISRSLFAKVVDRLNQSFGQNAVQVTSTGTSGNIVSSNPKRCF